LKSIYQIQSVERAVSILRLYLKGERDFTLTEVSDRLDLHPTTAFRFLMTLESSGLVEKDPETGKYRLGVLCLELGNAFLKQSDLRERALGFLESLRDNSQETVHLGILDGLHGVYLEKLPGLHPIGMMSSRVGSHFPIFCTGLGKAILANQPEDSLEDFIKLLELKMYTPSTITDPDQMIREIYKIRHQGFAIDKEEHELGVGCVGAPIFDPDGVVGAISASGPIERIKEKISSSDLVQQVIKTAESISSRLGGSRTK